MPSDIVGFSMYRRDTGEFAYQKGAVFCNLLLADEMNRTSPKTQSAPARGHGGAPRHGSTA